MLGLAHADDDRSANSPVDPNPCVKSADDFEARAHLHTILNPSNLASRHLYRPCSPHLTLTHCSQSRPGRRQEPKLVSGAMISDATQVVQSTVEPVASAPKSNINEKQSGKVQKTMDQARQGAPVCALHDSHTHAPVARSHR